MLVVFAEMWASALRLDVTVHGKESPPVKLSNGENSRYSICSTTLQKPNSYID